MLHLPEIYRPRQGRHPDDSCLYEGRGPLPARLLLLPAVPPIRPGIHLGRPDRRRDDRRQERRPPHRTAEHRLHGRGARRNQERPAGTHRRHRYRRQTVGRPCYARCSLGAEIAHTALRSIAVIQRVRPLQRPDAEHSRGIPLPAEQGRDQMGGSRTGSLGCDRVGRDRFVRSLQGYGTDR